jgi:NitT/TauT family transport system substrate-binding protein
VNFKGLFLVPLFAASAAAVALALFFHPPQAVAADASGSATLKVQKRQMENVAKLITNAGTPKVGYLEPAAYERTVKVLLAGGSSPVIKKDPGKAAYTHAVWEAASKK